MSAHQKQEVILKDAKACGNCGVLFRKDPRNTWKHWAKAKYCSRECAGEGWRKLSNERRKPIGEMFWPHVSKGDGCWEWTGIIGADGYGLLPYMGKNHRAHVLALELDGRPVPKGMYGCHHCDNRKCVNPSHLYVGTPLQNSADARRRSKTSKGEAHGGSKLNEAAVRDIRSSTLSLAKLAERYGVSVSTIGFARSGTTWKHVR